MATKNGGKAVIAKLNKAGKEVECVDVLFNPKELTFSKSNSWTEEKAPKGNVPATEFTSGGPSTLKIQLYFDTYKDAEDGKCEDVSEKYTKKIAKMMEVDPNWIDTKTKKGRPPTVKFRWGSFVGFEAVITSINQRFTLFLSDGTPVRAVLDVTFQQIKDKSEKSGTNPTSGGVGGERIWTVREGDTLPWIAFTEYNDSTQWRPIADANHLTHVRRLRPGMRLAIPSV
jgi:nucleoid-associated protein YgaU